MRNIKKLKKRQLRALFLVLLALFAYSTWVSYGQSTPLSNEDFLRFHVIANSDSQVDQALKLKVRDGLVEMIQEELYLEAAAQARPGMERVTLNMENARDYISKNLIRIEQAAKDILREEGYDYPVRAKLGVSYIPKKTYGNVTFPAGNYQALNVTIGEGVGQNWWCVLFPPLCLIGETEESEGSSRAGISQEALEQLYQEAISDKKYKELLEDTDEPKTIQLKFKSLELFH